MSHELRQIKIRLPLDVVEFLDVQTVRNSSTKTSEIVRAIRERMDRLTPSDQSAAA